MKYRYLDIHIYFKVVNCSDVNLQWIELIFCIVYYVVDGIILESSIHPSITAYPLRVAGVLEPIQASSGDRQGIVWTGHQFIAGQTQTNK